MKPKYQPLLLLLMTLPLAARAGEFAVGPETFSYTDPPGLCRIEAAHSEAEAKLVAMFAAADGPDLQALLVFYDCPFFESLGAPTGDAPDPSLWVRVVTARQGGELVVLPLRRETFLTQLGDELEKMLGDLGNSDIDAALRSAVERVNQEIATTSPGGDSLQLSKVEPLGVLAREDTAVYAGLVGVVSLGSESSTVLTVLGVTLIQGRPITVYLSRPYAGGAEAVQAQLAETRVLVADLVARNDPAGAAEEPPGEFLGIDWGGTAGYAIIGALVGLIVALVLRARKRRKS